MSGIGLVALALGLSNFAAAIGIGLAGVDGRLRIRIAVIFGFFEAAMPLLGLLVGHRVAPLNSGAPNSEPASWSSSASSWQRGPSDGVPEPHGVSPTTRLQVVLATAVG